MFAAKDETGKLVYAKLITDVNSKYFCVDCDEQVKLIVTKTNTKYFAHRNNHDNSNNETTIHKQAKLMLKQDFEKLGYNTDTEVYTTKDQRIDLLATKNHRQIAVEFQRSPIKDAKLCQRVHGYNAAGYQNLWFLGLNYFNKKLTWRQLKFLNHNRRWSWYLLFCDPEKQRYVLLHHVAFFGVMNSCQYQLQYLDDLNDLQKFVPRKNERVFKHNKLYTEAFSSFCYQNRLNYLQFENQSIILPPVLKDNLMWTLLRYQQTSNLDELVRIPAQIQIKPQLTEEVIAEVRNKLDILMAIK